MMPYPPSLRSRAASNMDPAMGASTWALGNHRWNPYRGALTINAINRARLDRRPVQELVSVKGVSSSIARWRVPVCVLRYRIVTKRGRELMSV